MKQAMATKFHTTVFLPNFISQRVYDFGCGDTIIVFIPHQK